MVSTPLFIKLAYHGITNLLKIADRLSIFMNLFQSYRIALHLKSSQSGKMPGRVKSRGFNGLQRKIVPIGVTNAA